MNKLANIEGAQGAILNPTLPGAAWDLVSFLENAFDYLEVVGGSLVTLLGLILVIWASVLIAKKFFGNGQSQGDSWFKIVLMIIIGGALLAGGIVLLTSIAEGGKTTIEELGGGFIVLQSAFALRG